MRKLFVAILFIMSAMRITHAAALQIDFSPNVARRDILTPSMENFLVPTDSPDPVNQTYGDVTVSLQASRGSKLETQWWRGGYDVGATMSTDGIVVHGGKLIVQLSGLRKGKHSIVTWHSGMEVAPVGTLSVEIQDGKKVEGIKPSYRAKDDADAESAYLEFEVKDDQPVTITISSNQPSQLVILNGLFIDSPDPKTRPAKSIPDDGDEHAAENPLLTWSRVVGVAQYDLYLGTDEKAVAGATRSSSEYKGRQAAVNFKTNGLTSDRPYFWRVDCVRGDGEKEAITPGDVWQFRIGHFAFPGAEGYGRLAIGGRGGRVIAVTNLEDSGPGSFRDAVEADGPRTVVFRVGGTIKLQSKLVIKNPYVTVAGQTAPGEGIALRDFTFGMIGVHDVIVRYMRVRIGDESGVTLDGMGMGSGTNHAIIDHCSISWSIDESVSSRQGKNITFQRNLIAEALNMSVHSHYKGTGKGHSFAGSISGDIGSFHHNLVAHCAGRNWSLAGGLTRGGLFGGRLDLRNNVVYNWAHRTNDGGAKAVNLVNNYYIPGPASRVFHLLEPDGGSPQDPQQYFVAGNFMDGRPAYDADNWKNGGVHVDPALIKQIKLDEPFCESYVKTDSAFDAYKSVMADSGANLPKSDSLDTRIFKEVAGRTFTYKGSKTGIPGIVDSQRDSGGYPELKPGQPPADTDGDGMPDAWETANHLNPNSADDGNGYPDASGYTNLEKYLQWIIDHHGALVP